MRRKALTGVVAAAALPLLAVSSFAQTPAPAPAPQPPGAPRIEPRWRVAPTPPSTVRPATPQTTPQITRRYTQFDELITPREWPRDDDINRMPETPGDRQDDDFGLKSAPAYDATRPADPLGPDRD